MKAFGLEIPLLMCISGAVQIASALYGSVLSQHSDWAKMRKKLVIFGFGLWAMIGVAVTIISSAQSAKQGADANSKLTTALATLQTASAEQTRLTGLNTELQNKLATQSDTIAGLARRAIDTTTGGSSFCYLRFMIRQDGVYPILLSKGRFPIYDLTMRLWDPDDWNDDTASYGQTLTKVNSETSKIGTLPAKDFVQLSRLALPSRIEGHYSVTFSARNGSWSQTVVLRRRGSDWKMATLVQSGARVVTFKELNKKPTPICYEANSDFPEAAPGELKQWVGAAKTCNTR